MAEFEPGRLSSTHNTTMSDLLCTACCINRMPNTHGVSDPPSRSQDDLHTLCFRALKSVEFPCRSKRACCFVCIVRVDPRLWFRCTGRESACYATPYHNLYSCASTSGEVAARVVRRRTRDNLSKMPRAPNTSRRRRSVHAAREGRSRSLVTRAPLLTLRPHCCALGDAELSARAGAGQASSWSAPRQRVQPGRAAP